MRLDNKGDAYQQVKQAAAGGLGPAGGICGPANLKPEQR